MLRPGKIHRFAVWSLITVIDSIAGMADFVAQQAGNPGTIIVHLYNLKYFSFYEFHLWRKET
jgi:hypothetical protein